MVRGKRTADEPPRHSSPPARSPEEREQQLINDAMGLAEQQIREGTASAQVITHYLKLGSSRERLEQQRLKREVILLDAKAEAMESAKVMEQLYANAIQAMRGYQGLDPLTVSSEVVDEVDDPDDY